MPFDIEEGAVLLQGSGTLETFLGPAEIIKNDGKVVVRGSVIQKNGCCFTSATQARIELGRCFSEGTRFEIGTTSIHASHPCIGKFTSLFKFAYRIFGFSSTQ